ncbi:hypothetical protein QBC39DRAFT_102932 [Podospora conica]|nr:hypothetical protein QBC39DRAFT_102932 [Schizothecium conicum]
MGWKQRRWSRLKKEPGFKYGVRGPGPAHYLTRPWQLRADGSHPRAPVAPSRRRRQARDLFSRRADRGYIPSRTRKRPRLASELSQVPIKQPGRADELDNHDKQGNHLNEGNGLDEGNDGNGLDEGNKGNVGNNVNEGNEGDEGNEAGRYVRLYNLEGLMNSMITTSRETKKPKKTRETRETRQAEMSGLTGLECHGWHISHEKGAAKLEKPLLSVVPSTAHRFRAPRHHNICGGDMRVTTEDTTGTARRYPLTPLGVSIDGTVSRRRTSVETAPTGRAYEVL